MKYGILYDSEHLCCSVGEYDTLEEAKNNLNGVSLDTEIEYACSEKLSIEIEWDPDELGFMAIMYSGDNKETAERYYETTHRIHEIDDDGNWSEDD